MTGTLYIVATPIGNLEDITQRALRIISEVDLIAAEDTRHTRKLLTHYGLSGKLVSYYDHNERHQAPALVKELLSGQSVALVSDAGTPTISDPGYLLVRQCRDNGISVIPIPGPTALIAALSASGLPSDQFYFGGFPPVKTGKRRRFFEELNAIRPTLIFYESPHRIQKTLAMMSEVFDGRSCVIARELCKVHEEFIHGVLPDVEKQLAAGVIKGEFVILIAGAGKSVPGAKN